MNIDIINDIIINIIIIGRCPMLEDVVPSGLEIKTKNYIVL